MYLDSGGVQSWGSVGWRVPVAYMRVHMEGVQPKKPSANSCSCKPSPVYCSRAVGGHEMSEALTTDVLKLLVRGALWGRARSIERQA